VSLPPGLENDPQLQALADAVPGNLANLRRRHERARIAANERSREYDTAARALTDLQAILAQATDPAQIQTLQEQQQILSNQLNRAEQRLNRAITREVQAESRLEPAQARLTALEDYLVGKSVNVFNGTATTSYSIRGSAPATSPFTSREDAAVDAIILAWTVRAATGTNIEYAGFIYEDTPGIFTYDHRQVFGRAHPVTGQNTSRTIRMALATGKEAVTGFPYQYNDRNEVGMFHIHPNGGGSSVQQANQYFGPGDLYASQRRSDQANADLAHYLGGSDGAIRVVLSPQSLPVAPQYNPGNPATHVFPPPSAYTNVRPPGFWRQ
jgi:hypothetical protein